LRRLTTLLCAVALAIGLAATAAGATSSPSALRAFLLHKGEMPGFTVLGTPAVGTSPASFVKNVYRATGSSGQSQVAALTAQGFLGGASEFLRSNDGLANSQVWVFKSDKDARSFVTSDSAQAKTELPKGSTITTLKVKFRGARAFTADSGQFRETDNYMPFGRCMLFVGDEVKGTVAAASAPVLAASRAVLGRAAGVCG
jgi:hypothetical protein